MGIYLQKNMVVEEKNPNLQLQCHRDTLLMEDFMKIGTQGEELAKLNRCRIFLRATCLSDPATGDGKSISPTFWHGKPSLIESQYKCPPQPITHQRAWENRKAALQTTFNISRYLSLPDNRRLGLYLPSSSTTGCI